METLDSMTAVTSTIPFASVSVGVLALAGLAAVIISSLGRGGPQNQQRRALPGPAGDGTFLANSLEVQANLPRLLDWTMEQSLKYGGENGLGTWSFKIFMQPHMTVTHNPENVRHILMNVNTYGKGPVFRKIFYPILGDGIFSADYDNWLTQRKRAANMFKVTNFKNCMLEAVRSKCLKCLNLIRTQVQADSPASAAAPTAVVDLQEHFFKMTLDTIGEIAFGQDLGSLSGKNLEFMEAFDYCQMYVSDLFFLPGPAWLWIYCTPAGWHFRAKTKVLQQHNASLVKVMIARELEEAAQGEKEENEDGDGEHEHGHKRKETILSYFLQKETHESLKHDPRTVNYLTDVIMSFQIAGRDTVAQAFSWAVHLLSLNPDVQEKAYQEAQAVLGSPTAAASATFDQIQRLEYLHAVVTEVLRLYPSVPKEAKWVFKDDVLPDGSRVAKCSWVLFAPYVMGRLETLWADARAFKPERHLDKPKPSNFVFTAFQGGPRLCLGMNLAYMQLQYGLALLLLSCHLAPVDGGKEVLPLQHSTTLPSQKGVLLQVTLRQGKAGENGGKKETES